MTKQTLSDQFNNVEQRFNSERHIYEKSHGNLKTLQAELLAYTDEYQEMPKQAEYVGEGTWRVFGSTFSAMQRNCDCCWDYVCNTFSGDEVHFQEASEAVAFLAGHAMADRWHNDAMHKAAAEEGRDAEDGGDAENGGDAIQLSVAT